MTIKTKQANSNTIPPTHLYPLSTNRKIISVDGKAPPTLLHPQLENKKEKQKKFLPGTSLLYAAIDEPRSGVNSTPLGKTGRRFLVVSFS